VAVPWERSRAHSSIQNNGHEANPDRDGGADPRRYPHRAGLEAPDEAISWIPFRHRDHQHLRSESAGSSHVTSSRPDTPPAIRFNFLSAALDREVTLEAMRITRRIMTAPAMADIATDEIAPG
jgi:choline dehydrogenase